MRVCAVTRGDLCSPLAAMLSARDRARRSGDGVRLRALAWHVAALHGAAITLCAMVTTECAAWAATEGV